MLKYKHSYKPQVFTNMSANDKLVKFYNEEILEEVKADLEITKAVFIDFSQQYNEFKRLQKNEGAAASEHRKAFLLVKLVVLLMMIMI